MSSPIKLYSSIFLAVLFLIYSCGTPETGDRIFPEVAIDETPFIRNAFVSTIDEAPVAFVTSWNHLALKKAGITSITMFSKGGKNPDDTLDKLVLTYSKNWTALLYQGFKFDETPTVWTSGKFSAAAKGHPGEIIFKRHYGIDKLLTTSIEVIDNGYRLLRRKTDSRFDTTWIFGTLTEPEAVASRIGKTLFSIDLYIKNGSSTQEIMAAFKKLPFDPADITSAQCTVIFTESGRPKEAFLLSDNFSQIAKTKAWTYNANHSIKTYQEWMGTSLVKDMVWEYGRSQLPEKLTIDRKTYFYRYD